jgi:hypothetical protein
VEPAELLQLHTLPELRGPPPPLLLLLQQALMSHLPGTPALALLLLLQTHMWSAVLRDQQQ